MEDDDDIESPGSSEQARLNKIPRGKPPFQLCFGPAEERGRSELSKPKLPRGACIITPKFYSKQDALTEEQDNLVKELEDEINTLRMVQPRTEDEEQILESNSYGWFAEPLMPMDKHDRRFNHHRITSEMVKIQGILHNASRADKFFEHNVSRKAKQ